MVWAERSNITSAWRRKVPRGRLPSAVSLSLLLDGFVPDTASLHIDGMLPAMPVNPLWDRRARRAQLWTER